MIESIVWIWDGGMFTFLKIRGGAGPAPHPGFCAPYAEAFFKAWSRSSLMSATSSRPMDSRM